jgi:hypothetical protein
MQIFRLSLLAAAVSLGGCAGGGSDDLELAQSRSPQPVDWRSIATEDDRARIRQWRNAWMRGIGKARAAGHAAALGSEGALVQPDAAVDWKDPPPGDYRCRTIKIGAKSDGLLDYVTYPPFACRIRMENGLMSFAKLTGSQRPLGLLLPDTARRMVFLGTLQLGDERRALEYGKDRERDMAGVVERIGANRWRLVFPYPHFESTVDILELVPAA